ncbi:FAD-dependent oxidoreductase [Kribbella sp. NPDC020789]
MEERSSVLIAGGSLTGLSTAVFLARRGVDSVLVERHPGTSIHPRFRAMSPRTMELYSRAGLAEALDAITEPAAGSMAWGDALSDADLQLAGHSMLMLDTKGPQPSPAGLRAADQDRFEPVLHAHAEALGADLRFGTELTAFDQDDEGVTATILDRGTGRTSRLRARYLVGADGPRSTVREGLGIAMTGGSFSRRMSIVFRADLSEALAGRELIGCFFPKKAAFLSRRDSGRWQLTVPFYPERGESAADFTTERCVELIRDLTGLPGLEPAVVSMLPWDDAEALADTFGIGRVFLAGDAAHTTGPWTGTAGNIGVQDADDLAWKLDAVLDGRAGEGLLETYSAERRPVAEAFVSLSTRRRAAQLTSMAATLADGLPLESLSFLYGCHDYPEPGRAVTLVNPYNYVGRPGLRAPYVVLERNGEEISTLDLFGNRWVLLAGPDGEGWCEAARACVDGLGIALDVYRVGGELGDPAGRWTAAYGVAPDGAVIVRPDGFIGWSAPAVEPAEDVVGDALLRLCARTE